MRAFLGIWLVMAALMGVTAPVCAQDGVREAQYYWLLHETRRMKGGDCPDGPGCVSLRRFDPQRFDPALAPAMAEVMRRLKTESAARGQVIPPKDAPKFCENRAFEGALNFDPETLELAPKLEVLRDLPGVYFDLTGLKPPEGFPGAFGKTLQAAFEGRFRRAGIRVLSKEEAERAPGHPVLNVYFSHTNPETGCWYSVFASLSQTVLLTRDPLVKFRAGTWSASSGIKTVGEAGTELDAILWVADKLVRDVLVANEKAPKASP